MRVVGRSQVVGWKFGRAGLQPGHSAAPPNNFIALSEEKGCRRDDGG